MTGPNGNGKYSICRTELQEESDGVNYITLRWGYDTEEQAINDPKNISQEEGVDLSDLAVVGATFAVR